MLKDLDKNDYDIVLVDTQSTKMKMFIRDKLKLKFRCNKDTIINVDTKKDLKYVREILGLMPPFSDRWFVIVNMDKVPVKELESVLDASTTCVFLCFCSKYRDYKQMKEDMKERGGIIDLYISYLRRGDMIYLYDAFVPSDNKMSKQLFDFFVQSYSGDVEEVLSLFEEMNAGTKISSRKDIADICGIGGLTVEGFALSLLKPLSKSEKGFKKVVKNRIVAGTELGEVYGYSKFYSFLKNVLFNFTQIKELRMTGDVYKSVRNLPNGYDEKILARYNRYIWQLNTIPLSRILLLYEAVGSKSWRGNAEFLNSLYRFYIKSYEGIKQ